MPDTMTSTLPAPGTVGPLPENHPTVVQGKVGVLLVNLGTPDGTDYWSMRRYLSEFLSDPRVIEVPQPIWQVILQGPILTFRPSKSGRAYKKIWTDEGSPLLVYTKKFTDGIRERFGDSDDIIVEFGMRYGNPSLESVIDSMIERGCNKILLVPMYPQYSATTTASIYDAVFKHLLNRRNVPTLKVMEPYYSHPAYIQAVAKGINEYLRDSDTQFEKLVFSFHGIPEEYIVKGDYYCCQCSETSASLIPLLNFPKKDIIHTYQSRFGRDPWLVPYTDETIEHLGEAGIKRVAVACPGFTADCLETLDEIGNEALEEFQEAGGEVLKLIPGLNDSPDWIDSMFELIQEELGPWMKTAARTKRANNKIACPVLIEKARVANDS